MFRRVPACDLVVHKIPNVVDISLGEEAQSDECTNQALREFCVIELSVVVHCRANWATGAPTVVLILQQVIIQRSIFEPSI